MAGAEPPSAFGAAWRDRRHRDASSSFCSTCSSRSRSASVSPGFRVPPKRPRKCASTSSSDESLSQTATSSTFEGTRDSGDLEDGIVRRQSRRRKRSAESWRGSNSGDSDSSLRKGPRCRARKSRKDRFGSWSPMLSSSTESIPVGRGSKCGPCRVATSEVNQSVRDSKLSVATHRLISAEASPGYSETNTRLGRVKRSDLSFAGTSASAGKQLGAETGLRLHGTRSEESLSKAACRERAMSVCAEAGDVRDTACRPSCHSPLGSDDEEHFPARNPQPVVPVREQPSLPVHTSRVPPCSCQGPCACELVSLVMQRCKLTACTAAVTNGGGGAGADARFRLDYPD